MPLRYKRRLISHLQHDDYAPRRMQDVATDLGIEPVEFPEFEEALKSLADDRIIEINQAGFVQLPSVSSRGGYITGSFRKNARGFGFLIPAEPIREGDI